MKAKELQKEFEDTGYSSWINSEIYPDGRIYTKEYTEWVEKNLILMRERFNNLSFPDEQEISSMRLEMDCPTPNEEIYTTDGFKAGVRWLKNTIKRQLKLNVKTKKCKICKTDFEPIDNANFHCRECNSK